MSEDAPPKATPRTRAARLWFVALVLVGVVALGALATGVILQQRSAAQGTIVVNASGRQATWLEASSVAVRNGSGWQPLGRTGRLAVAAAPTPTQLLQGSAPAGRYSAIMIGGHEFPASFTVQVGVPSPVLVQILGGRPLTVYAGQDQVNLGEQELSGRLQAMPTFDLETQDGRPFTNASMAGKTVILAAFETTCHETCPLYTGLFLQLARKLPRNVMLVEASINPWDDTPAALRSYAAQTGADWTLVTGSLAQMGAFWKPFGVQLSASDVHSSTLMVIDEHGYVRHTYQGIPDVENLPADLRGQLDQEGYYELHHADGWGEAQILTSVGNIQQLVDSAPAGGQAAKSFSGPDLRGGGTLSLAQFRGRPVVVNFFASYCAPCRTELPMLQRQA
ncbi:MAG: redoxin family protein, partial [Candidatus Dormibacteraceae bacterium]